MGVLYLLCGILLAVLIPLRIQYIRKRAPVLDFETAMAIQEPVIVYLRSFGDDGKGGDYPVTMSTAVAGHFVKYNGTYEYTLLKPFRKRFTVIAIGKPGEELPEVGALRLYVADEVWQQCVADLLQKARYVVIRPANSDGLNWEINYIITQQLLPKLILSTTIGNLDDTAVRAARFKKFGTRFRELAGIELPAYSPKTPYIRFDASRKPIAMKKDEVVGLG